MTESRVRVLVVSTRVWDAATFQLALIAQQCARQSLPVQIAAHADAVPYWRTLLPDAPVTSLDPVLTARQLKVSIGSVASAVRANLILVDSASLRRTALSVAAERAAVLERLSWGQAPDSAGSSSWLTDGITSRLRGSGRRAGLLVPTVGDTVREPGAAASGMPQFAIPMACRVSDSSAEDAAEVEAAHAAATGADAAEVSTADPHAVLVVIPDVHAPLSALPALRAAAQVARRHNALRIVIPGHPDVTQPLRVQAAALRIAEYVDTTPPRRIGEPFPAGTVAVWATAEGDAGATAILHAMAARIPVLLPGSSPLTPFIADRITGFEVEGHDPLGDAVAAGIIARLLAHRSERRSIGAAARARVQRLHSPEKLGDAVIAAHDRLMRGVGAHA